MVGTVTVTVSLPLGLPSVRPGTMPVEAHYHRFSKVRVTLRLVKVILWPTVSRSCLGVRPPSGTRGLFSFSFSLKLDSCRFVIVGRPLWREGGSVIYSCCWASPPQSFSGPSSTGSHNEILSQIWDSLNLESQVPLCISPRNRVALLYPQALGDSGCCWSWSYVATDYQSASLSWCRTSIWGPWPDFYYSRAFAGFLCVVPSLARGWICNLLLQLLLNLASAVTRAEVLLLSHLRPPPPSGGPGIRIYNPPPRNKVAQLNPRALGSLFVALHYMCTVRCVAAASCFYNVIACCPFCNLTADNFFQLSWHSTLKHIPSTHSECAL
jgi:hypothetical protein